MKCSVHVKRIFANGGTYLLLCICSLLVLSPIFWTFSTSLKTPADINRFPPSWIPQTITLEHYIQILSSSSFYQYMFNTFVVAVFSIFFTLLVAIPSAYVAARYRFRGKNLILFIILFTSMMPGIATLPTLYILSIKANLYDTLIVLVLVFSAWRAPTAMWLLRGFVSTIPRELEEAAMIDGCSRFGGFFRIVLPLMCSGIAAVSVLVFIFVWNTWIFASSLTNTPAKSLITVGLYANISDIGIKWGTFTAYSILTILPIIIIYLSAQKYFIAGLASGANKG
jgi:ABC-type glycerol-3-phosphate transport system permease component